MSTLKINKQINTHVCGGGGGQSGPDVRVNHSPVSSVKVKNEWKYVYTSTPHIYLYGRDGKNFIFQFTLLYRCLPPESPSLTTRKSRSCWPMFWQWFKFGCWKYNSDRKLNEHGQHFPWSDTHSRQSRNQQVALTNAEVNTVLTLKVHWMLIYMV